MAVAGGLMLASVVIKEATGRLSAAIGGEIKLRWNFNKDLQKMKDTLESIEVVLHDAERRCFNEEATVQLWLKRLRDAAEGITNMIDIYEARTTSNPSSYTQALPILPRIMEYANASVKFLQLLSKIFHFRKLTKFSMAKKNIADQRHDYGFKQESSPNRQQLPDKREQLVEAWNLTSRIYHSQLILPIYGIGGIGKTTLAKLISSEAMFQDFSQVWIYVPQTMSDLKQIGNFIISEVSKIKSEILSVQTKIYIVLDDLLESKPSKLYSLKAMLNVGNGSKVIVFVTTRDKHIADKICTVEPYKIPLFTNDMCWTIVKQKVNFEARPYKDQLETDLALAAQTLGYMLESRTFDEWESVKNNYFWDKSSSNVIASLMLSYNNMHPYLKLCFAYCATFPKGYKRVKDDLIYQWISLGFVEPPTPSTFSTWQHGENYVSHLMAMSFLQYTKSHHLVMHHEVVTMFTMHDLVHDLLARSVMSFKSFTQYPTKVRALRFLKICGKIRLHEDVFSSAKYLRVLDLSECSIQKLPNFIGPGRKGGITRNHCFQFRREPNMTLGDLKQLRYLNASRVQHQDPFCIEHSAFVGLLRSWHCHSHGEMECLTYLDLSGCFRLENLTVSFGKLTKLVHLDLSNCCHVTHVSESLKSLTNLEYLDLSGCSNIGKLPEHVGSLLKLRNLNLSYSSYIQGSIKAEALVNLDNLRYLKLSRSFWNLRNTGPITFGNLKHLVYLDLSCSVGIDGLLKDLGSLTKLNYLNLSKCLADLNLELMSKAMANLTELGYLNLLSSFIFSMEGEAALSIVLQCISNLPNLEHLDLWTFQGDCRASSSNLVLLQEVNRRDLGISRLENVKSMQEVPTINLTEKETLKELELNWTKDAERFVEDKEQLGELVPTSNLENLHLYQRARNLEKLYIAKNY
uniref:NB-ARC domain-containing protein n=1 Tax=Setaria viridis TaxID=4556 RepID=A0A4U6TGT9_SETVI|nr:hypothetical protein SEVIR_8G097700v2 [Setaria viridis]